MSEITPNEVDNVEVGDVIASTSNMVDVNDVVDVNNVSISEYAGVEMIEESASQIPVYSKPNQDTNVTDDDFRWYCVRTYTSFEERVKKTMDSEIKRLGLGYCIREVVIPVETVFETRNGKKKTKLRNFLPGYVLVNAAISEQKKTKKKIIDAVVDITGVVAFVGRKNDPSALQPFEVERIFNRINERAEVATMDTTFRQGDPVVVIVGPFTGFKGSVSEVTNEKQKIKVEITILGRKTPVELGLEQVQFDKPE